MRSECLQAALVAYMEKVKRLYIAPSQPLLRIAQHIQYLVSGMHKHADGSLTPHVQERQRGCTAKHRQERKAPVHAWRALNGLISLLRASGRKRKTSCK